MISTGELTPKRIDQSNEDFAKAIKSGRVIRMEWDYGYKEGDFGSQTYEEFVANLRKSAKLALNDELV